MLVLSRKTGEALSIGQGITVEIIAIEGDRVRIGITAPPEIRIFRAELLQETKDINKSAVTATTVTFPVPEK